MLHAHVAVELSARYKYLYFIWQNTIDLELQWVH
jgi:hypothetical protein